MLKPVLLACGAAAALLAGVALRQSAGDATSATAPATPVAAAAELPFDPSPAREALATALRAGDTRGALRLLEPANSTNEPQGADARLLLGLAAHAHEQMADAARWLRQDNAGDLIRRGLGDWRLSALADAAAAVGDRPTAITALEALLADFPGSPLGPLARVRLAELL